MSEEYSSTTYPTDTSESSTSSEDIKRSHYPASAQLVPSYLTSAYPPSYGQGYRLYPLHYIQQPAPTYPFSLPSSPLYQPQAPLVMTPTGEFARPLVPQPAPYGPPVPLHPHAASPEGDTSSLGTLQALDSSAGPLPLRQRTRPGVADSRQRSGEIYEDGGWEFNALNPCVLVVLIITIGLLVLLGAASKLLRVLGEEYIDKSPVIGVNLSKVRSDAYKTSSRSPEPSSNVAGCTSDACRWEAQYLLGKLNNTVSPCQDFYSYVCSSNWFKDGPNADTQPFTYRASAMVMLALWDYLKIRADNKGSRSFVNLAAVLVRGCVQGTKRDTEWAAFRDIFDDINIPGWPYENDAGETEPHDVAKVTDKLLGTATFVKMALRQRYSDQELELHMDSPPIFLRRHETIYPGEHLKTYSEFIFKVLSLWKPPSNITHTLAIEIVQLEQVMSEAAAHSARSVPSVHVTRPVVKFKSTRHWDWFVYFSYLTQEVSPSITSSMVVLHDPLYVDHLHNILSHTYRRTLLNYVGYRLVIHLSPLLPISKAGFLVPLSHQFQIAEGVPGRLQACMFLLERLYPFGVRSLLWSVVLSKSHSLITGDTGLAEDIKQIEDIVRLEMKGRASTAPWLTPNESLVAGVKIDRMEIQMIPPDNEMSLPIMSFPPNVLEPGKLLLTYYKLLRFMRSQYWAARDPTFFREPSTPSGSAFRPGFSYDPERNVVSLSPATAFFVAGVSRRFEATSVPFLVAPLVRGMFSAIDIRGSTVDADGVVRKWWSMSSRGKFLIRAMCLEGSFAEGIKQYVKDSPESSVFLEENAADGAVLRPLYNIFLKLENREVMTALQGQPPNSTLQGLFFINYATTFCEPPRSAVYSKKQLLYKVGVPSKLRVNVPLSRFRIFAEVFGCALGTPMNPAHACSFW